MRKHTRQFIVDVWFVLAVAMPLCGATALALVQQNPHWGSIAVEAFLAGPIGVVHRTAGTSWSLFLAVCAAPTLWCAVEALALRILHDAEVEQPWIAAVVMSARHLLLIAIAGGVAAWSASPVCVWVTLAAWSVSVAGAILALRAPRKRRWAWEVAFGCVLAERLVFALGGLWWVALAAPPC